MVISLKPRSLFSVSIAGCALVALPLAVVAIVAIMYAKELAFDSNRLLTGGLNVTQQSRMLEGDLISMERAARQYQIVEDTTLLQLFNDRYKAAKLNLGELQQIREGINPGNLQQLQSDIDDIASTVHAGNAQAMTSSFSHFDRMHRTASETTEQARDYIREEARLIREKTDTYEHHLIQLTVLAIPLTAAVALFLAYYVALPLRRMDRAIRDLGAGRFDQAIAFGGPHELASLSRQLDWLRSRLHSIEQDKNRFLRQMAHELKTPLSSVREGAELLADGVTGALTEQQQEVAVILRNNSLELQILIENLLAYEEWRERSQRIEISDVALRPLIERCVQRYRLIVASQDIRLKLEGVDLTVRIDAERLRLILDNLISNALKYSPKRGLVSVAALVRPPSNMERGRHWLVIDVIDEGPGIADAERSRIFEPFYRGTPPPGAHLAGTGIGLAVVRDCVDAHGGKIDLLDNKPTGTHFRVRIPLALKAVGASHAD